MSRTCKTAVWSMLLALAVVCPRTVKAQDQSSTGSAPSITPSTGSRSNAAQTKSSAAD